MSGKTPNQERAWNAYGQTMAAAIGLELILRIANMTARFHAIEAGPSSAGNKQAQHEKVRRNAGEGTFGQIAAQFCNLYPSVAAADPNFQEALANAVDFRNHLTHGFLAGRLSLLRSEKGLDLITLECRNLMAHFQQLEDYVRDKSGVDFGLFGADGDEQAAVANHPLAHLLDDADQHH